MQLLIILIVLLLSYTPAYSDNGMDSFFRDVMENVCKNDPNYCAKAGRPYLNIPQQPENTSYTLKMLMYFTNDTRKSYILDIIAYSPDLKDAKDDAWERESKYFSGPYRKAFKKIRNASLTQNCLGFVLQQLLYEKSPKYRNLQSEFATIGVNNFYEGFMVKYMEPIGKDESKKKNDIVVFIQDRPGGNAIHVGIVTITSNSEYPTLLSKDKDGFVFEITWEEARKMDGPVAYFKDPNVRWEFYRMNPNQITIKYSGS